MKTVDLSQTGEVVFMFDRYDPKQHSIVWDMDKGKPTPAIEFVFKSGSDAEKIRNAIYIRKVEDGASGSQPVGAK